MKGKYFVQKTIIALFVMIGISTAVYATDQNVQFTTKLYNDKYLQWLELPKEERENTIAPSPLVKEIKLDTKKLYISNKTRMLGASAKYDPRNALNLKVKNQGVTESCWAMSATTVLEAYKKKVENKQVEYSPLHMEYATSKTFLDGTNPNGYNRELNGRGNILLAYCYMASGRGPVLESDMPFNESMNKVNLSEIEGKTVQAELDEYVAFANIYKEKSGSDIVYTNGQEGDNRRVYTTAEITQFRNTIKEHILKYGAVTAQVNASGFEFYSNTSSPLESVCYYCDDKGATIDHQVTIIGWDDNYAVTNFNAQHRPTKPGAYLVQNSYGITQDGGAKKVFDNGYLYISYEDFMIETAMSGIKKLSNADYKHIYQYDPLGNNQMLTSNVDKIVGANVFSKSANELEVLDKVAFYPIEGYTYEIYVNAKDGDLSNLTKVKTVGKIDNCFYTTIELDEPILLTGSKFVVGISYITPEGACLPIECTYGTNTSDLFYTATSKRGESYICTENSLKQWTDMKDLSITDLDNANFCLKAITHNLDALHLYSKIYDISNGKISRVDPNTKLATFRANTITNGVIEVYNRAGQKLNENDLVTTGSTVKLSQSASEYKLVVTADLNGDGKATTTDLLMLKRYIVNHNVQIKNCVDITAGDINFNSEITTTDLLQLKRIIVDRK